ncbi:MAG: YdcF family protein, partial [Patescibacteria group bacterium]
MFWKISKYLIYLIAIAGALYIGALVYVLSFSIKPNIPEHADAILILGAKVNLDNSPSDPLYERTNEAVKLYAQNKADYIITTGG